VNTETAPWTIVGQGLAGTCLAWEFLKRGEPFRMIDRGQGGSSRVAAGLINPITGKNFQLSSRIAEFLPTALEAYHELEARLGIQIWHPLPVLRLAADEKEWAKIVSKLSLPEVQPWLAKTDAPPPSGWIGAIEIIGGGRLDTRAFLDASRDFFTSLGIFQWGDVPSEAPRTIRCEGAAGLITGRLGPHRCAKGEILTVHAPGWPHSHIRVGGGGWLVPIGSDRFKAGATYEWDQLDEQPTDAGKSRVRRILQQLGGDEPFEIIDHQAGIRPIMRRSEALIGPLDSAKDQWMFNGLGSKGSLYAPGMARHLAAWLLDGIEPEPSMDFRKFLSL
jgi:glycine/D-amino acid oxidase-like deaminating enzyme